jgi:nucleotide-binding universal stress UspA family protein
MLHLSTILVPLDGSSFAEQALPLARQLAHSSGARLRLVMVHTPATTWDPGVEFTLFDPEMERQLRERELAYLDAIARRITSESGIQIECALLSGAIGEALEQYVERTGTDMVVLTSHGRGGLGRIFLGNVADQLVRRLNVPLLVIRPVETPAAQPERHRILVPLDGSPLAESILEEARVFARITGSELLLTMIVQPIPVLLPPFIWPPEQLTQSPQERELSARRYIETVKERLKAEGLVVQSRVRVGRKVAREILRLVQEEKCSMVAMATHGAGGLDRMMLGSVADQVVRHAETPVLLIRPGNTPSEIERSRQEGMELIAH